MTADEEKLSWQDIKPIMDQLDACCHEFDVECIKQILQETPTGYNIANKQ